MGTPIEELELDIKTYNRLKRGGFSTTDDLLAAMYEPGAWQRISQPDMKRVEAAMKSAGIIRFMRGDTVSESDVEQEPLTWEELHGFVGRLVVQDRSTESKRWLVVCWIYDIRDDGEGRLLFTDGGRGYCHIRMAEINGGRERISPMLRYEGQFFELKEEESGTPLDRLCLSVRTYNAAKRFGIETVEQLEREIGAFCQHARKSGEEARQELEKWRKTQIQLTQEEV